jgi:hypothetical protein
MRMIELPGCTRRLLSARLFQTGSLMMQIHHSVTEPLLLQQSLPEVCQVSTDKDALFLHKVEYAPCSSHITRQQMVCPTRRIFHICGTSSHPRQRVWNGHRLGLGGVAGNWGPEAPKLSGLCVFKVFQVQKQM